ncbi:MAG: hypothetical protein C4530_24175, partial [Desulfobacteraceae bacterium]
WSSVTPSPQLWAIEGLALQPIILKMKSMLIKEKGKRNDEDSRIGCGQGLFIFIPFVYEFDRFEEIKAGMAVKDL